MTKTKRPKKTANIDQLQSGKWRARWVDELGTRRSSTHWLRDDAKFALKTAQLAVEEARRGLRGMCFVDKTLHEVWCEWRVEVGRHKRSAPTDRSFWIHHLEPAFGASNIRSIDAARCSAFIARQESRVPSLSPSTIRHHRTLLITLLRFAQTKGWLGTVPKIRKPTHSANTDNNEFRYLKSQAEIVRVLDAARFESLQLKLLYAIPILAGLRLGEVCGLQRRDIDLSTGSILVKRSYAGATKSGRSRRVLIVNDLRSLLEPWLRNLHESDLLFKSKSGTMLRRDSPPFRKERALGRVLKRAGFSEDYVSYHGFRHTFASLYLMNGGDLFKLQRYLGHQSMDTTQRYSHFSPEHFQADRDRVSLAVDQRQELRADFPIQIT